MIFSVHFTETSIQQDVTKFLLLILNHQMLLWWWWWPKLITEITKIFHFMNGVATHGQLHGHIVSRLCVWLVDKSQQCASWSTLGHKHRGLMRQDHTCIGWQDKGHSWPQSQRSHDGHKHKGLTRQHHTCIGWQKMALACPETAQ